MKKTKLITIGTIAAVIAPIATVVSCGTNDTSEKTTTYEIKNTNIVMLRKLNDTEITSNGEVKANTRKAQTRSAKKYKKISEILGQKIVSVKISSKKSNILKGKINFEAKIISDNKGKKVKDTFVLNFDASKSKDLFEGKNVNLIDYIKVNGVLLKDSTKEDSTLKKVAVSFIANKLNDFVRSEIENKIANIKLPKTFLNEMSSIMFEKVEIIDASYTRMQNNGTGRYVRLISRELTSKDITDLNNLLKTAGFHGTIRDGLSVIKQSLNKLNSKDFILDFATIKNSRIWDWDNHKQKISNEIETIKYTQGQNIKTRDANQAIIDKNEWILGGRKPSTKFSNPNHSGGPTAGAETTQLKNEKDRLIQENKDLVIYTAAELAKKISDLKASNNNGDVKRLAIEIKIDAFDFKNIPSQSNWRDSLITEKFLSDVKKNEIKDKAKFIFDILKKHGK